MTWFKMQAQSDSSPPVISIIGVIGKNCWDERGVDLSEFSAELKSLGDVDEITVEIASGGGSFFAGLAIYNLLKNHKAKVTTRILSEASSAASLIFLSGDVRSTPPNTASLIHRSSAGLSEFLNSSDLLKLASDLDALDGQAASIYAATTSLSADDALNMMAENTLLTGDDMYKNGFATHLDDEVSIAASSDSVLSGFELRKLTSCLELAKTENTALKASLASALDSAEKPQIACGAMEAISLCRAGGVESLATRAIEREMSKSAVVDMIAMCEKLKPACENSGVEMAAIIGIMDDPAQIVSVVANEVMAAADDSINSKLKSNDKKKAAIVNPTKIYADRKRGR